MVVVECVSSASSLNQNLKLFTELSELSQVTSQGLLRFARNDRLLANVILVTVCWTRRDRLGKRE